MNLWAKNFLYLWFFTREIESYISEKKVRGVSLNLDKFSVLPLFHSFDSIYCYWMLQQPVTRTGSNFKSKVFYFILLLSYIYDQSYRNLYMITIQFLKVKLFGFFSIGNKFLYLHVISIEFFHLMEFIIDDLYTYSFCTLK